MVETILCRLEDIADVVINQRGLTSEQREEWFGDSGRVARTIQSINRFAKNASSTELQYIVDLFRMAYAHTDPQEHVLERSLLKRSHDELFQRCAQYRNTNKQKAYAIKVRHLPLRKKPEEYTARCGY